MGYATVGHVPLLGAEGADEFFVMGYHYDAAFVIADSDGETAEGVAVKEVSRFVEDEKMWVVPHSTGFVELVTGKFYERGKERCCAYLARL